MSSIIDGVLLLFTVVIGAIAYQGDNETRTYLKIALAGSAFGRPLIGKALDILNPDLRKATELIVTSNNALKLAVSKRSRVGVLPSAPNIGYQ
jgi:hypothetical protein